MIPFKPGKLAEAVDPIKIYEYLFFGLPVIVTGIPHLAELPDVRVVSDERDFMDAVDSFMNDQNHRLLKVKGSVLRVDEMIGNLTWEQRFAKLIEALGTKEWIF
jgi:hypothetical protein